MAINSNIILAKGIKIDKDYLNVLSYSESDMLNLLRQSEHLIYEANNYSFIDEFQNIINVQVPYGDCITMNYMAFQNPRYNNKWFFCFIDKIEYNSEKSTNITFHVDSWTTWFPNLVQETCYTIREHVRDDEIGANRVDENLDVGEMCCLGLSFQSLGTNHFVAVQCNYIPKDSGGDLYSGISLYNSTIFGTKLLFFQLNDYGLADLAKFIFVVAADGYPSSIEQMFIVPDGLFTLSEMVLHHVDRTYNTTNDYSFDYYTYPWTYGTKTKTVSIAKQTSYSDYTCKNNKCFCYPYQYLLCSNTAGSEAIYKYEDFLNSINTQFIIEMSLSVGLSARIVPRGYKILSGSTTSVYMDILPIAKFPTCAWSTDSYINWLTQNSVNIPVQITSLIAGAALSAAGAAAPAASTAAGQYSQTMSAAGAGANLVTGIGNLIGQFHQAKLLPNISSGQNTGDVNFAAGRCGLTYFKMRCRLENLKIIDDYFTRFGYKILRVKIPELHSRRYWNYIEIGKGENFGHGDIPQSDLEVINSIAQRGFTVWHSHNAIGDFTLTNSIIV